MALLEASRVDRVSASARDVNVSRGLLTVVAAVLYGVGWTVTATVVGTVMAVRWSWAAVLLGAEDYRARAKRREAT